MRMRSTLSWYEEVEYPWIFHKRSKIKIKDKESLSSSFYQNIYLMKQKKITPISFLKMIKVIFHHMIFLESYRGVTK